MPCRGIDAEFQEVLLFYFGMIPSLRIGANPRSPHPVHLITVIYRSCTLLLTLTLSIPSVGDRYQCCMDSIGIRQPDGSS